jgi:putative effector of murein hydrolase
MISIVCTLCTAAHAVSNDRAAKMQRTALVMSSLMFCLCSLMS